MGIFSAIFGVAPYISQEKRSITKREILALVSQGHTNTLSPQEEKDIEAALILACDSFSKISLRKIDEVLRHLQYQKKISLIDRQGVFTQFETYFNT